MVSWSIKNIERHTLEVPNLARCWSISPQISYSYRKVANSVLIIHLTYLTLWPRKLSNCIACKRFAVQSLLWSLEFLIHRNLKHHDIAVSNVARSWSISSVIGYSFLKVSNSGTRIPLSLLDQALWPGGLVNSIACKSSQLRSPCGHWNLWSI